jgi:nucleotide-binding universal stress UspA family protein
MEFSGFKNILVPVDFSAISTKAFFYTLEMLKCGGGKLQVLHVLDTDFLTGAVHITIEPLDESVAKWRARAEEKLKKLFAREEEGVEIEFHIREGHPEEEILAMSGDLDVDLVVLGTHGRHGLEKAIFGSVAEKVLRLSEKPLLLIK